MASDKLLTLTDQNFETEVYASSTPTLVDFWAVWCAPCRAIAPAVEAVAIEFEGRLRVGKLDVDHNQKTATHYDVSSIPRLLLFNGKTFVGQMVGAANKEKIRNFVKEHLDKIEQQKTKA